MPLSLQSTHLVRSAASSPPEQIARLSTGLPDIDELLGGGILRGHISEIIGPVSSGKSALLFSTLAQATQRLQAAAYVDVHSSFDPLSAQAAGIELTSLLWIRCSSNSPTRRLEQAFKAADILTTSGGFDAIALDLEGPTHCQNQPSPPPSSWFRLKRAIAHSKTALLVTGAKTQAGSSASTRISLVRQSVDWKFGPTLSSPSKTRLSLLQGFVSRAQLTRGKRQGHATFHSCFQS